VRQGVPGPPNLKRNGVFFFQKKLGMYHQKTSYKQSQASEIDDMIETPKKNLRGKRNPSKRLDLTPEQLT
jgi:hypothetical protein